jgi:predicted unusual protein kinase regulating ubiquinone biosynthesis (AarF/ABC1/UbiB family)
MLKTLKLAKLAATVPLYPVMPSKKGYARWIRREVESAGCLYVKIGQWVSSRTDVFPMVITEEFASLRNSSDAMPTEAVTKAVSMLTFESFDKTPVSTGSIAQVHRATFQGREVAVKIQRPNLLRELVSDIGAIKWILGFVKATNPKMHDDLVSSLDDLIETVRRELDFKAEAEHMTRFGDFFGDEVVIPRVIVVTENVIIMDYIESRPFSGRASTLMDLFFRQFFELGWLHTDMHAGNVAQLPDGKTVVLFDFGSVMYVPDDIRLCIKSLMVSYMNRNVSVMLDYMLEYGMLTGGNPGPEERAMLESFLENVLDYVEVTDIAKFTEVMKTIPVYDGPTTTFRSEVFLIMRTFTLMEGLCKSLDPDFVILDAVAPLTQYFSRDPYVIRLKVEDDLRNFIKGVFSE